MPVRIRTAYLGSRAFARLCASGRHFVPSPEQNVIVDACKEHNVVVSARPGAGKTATAEALVQANPDVPIAIITYSKQLQISTARRLSENRYPNVDTFTFHGLATRLFGKVVYDDSLLRDLRKRGAIPSFARLAERKYKYVVLDELQDLTDDLFWLTYMFLSASAFVHGTVPRILALGDSRQAIYDFKGADSRYLDLAPAAMGQLSSRGWRHLNLSKSFRLSPATATFVNDAFLGGESYIEADPCGSHERPLYVHADLKNRKELLDTLLPLIRKYGAENTALLAPSVRTNPFLRFLANKLSVSHNIPVNVSISDEAPVDPYTQRGKVAISTYHQFKGSERDLVVVFGADSSYFKYFARSAPEDRCPNAVFVALTRARRLLVLVHCNGNPPMPFVSWPAVERHADLINLSHAEIRPVMTPKLERQPELSLPKRTRASNFARHVPQEELTELADNYLDIARSSPLPRKQHIRAPDKVCTNSRLHRYEPVSDINGKTVTESFRAHFGRLANSVDLREDLPPLHPVARAVWITRKAVDDDATASGYAARRHQMRNMSFDWLVPHLEPATQRLARALADEHAGVGTLKFEEAMSIDLSLKEHESGPSDAQSTKLMGYADIVHTQGNQLATIWEVKFTTSLSLEHAVQAAAYGFLWAAEDRPFPRIVLFNVRDGERWDITATREDAHSLVQGVLRAKYTPKGETSTTMFLDMCARARAEVERGLSCANAGGISR